MNYEKLQFIDSYLEKLENAKNSEMDNYDIYVDTIQDLIIEISNVFGKELPEIETSVFLRHDSVTRDVDTTIGIIRKFLIENGYKRANKTESQIDKFLVGFKAYFENELPYKKYLRQEYIGYDNWNGGTYYLDIDYNYQYNLNYGIDYTECTSMQDIKMFIELAFSNWIETDKRYDFTKEINSIFKKFQIPFKLQKGKVVSSGYKTTTLNDKIINYNMLERKIQYAEEMILSSETLDKKCALDYIIDSLQYVISIQQGRGVNDKYTSAATKISDNQNGKTYSVIKSEIEELMKISNEFFDIRHNEYLNKSKEIREAITDSIFIEYLYNRAYALLYILRLKH